MSEFIKLGNKILPKPKGVDYELTSGNTYSLKWDDWNGELFLVEEESLNLPEKLFESTASKALKTRIFKYFETTTNQNTGVILAGEKGTGKSIDAKIIARDSGLPIIVIDPDCPARRLPDMFKKFSTPVCVIFDEVEKNFHTEGLLEFLDGIGKTCKKLVIMTCNKLDKVSEYMQNRCSRVRYLRTYTVDDNFEFLPFLLDTYDIKNKDEVKQFIIDNMKLPSIDNMTSFINEIKLLEDADYSLSNIARFMNIEIAIKPKKETPKNTNKEELRNKIEEALNSIGDKIQQEKDIKSFTECIEPVVSLPFD